jgi:hypothetical protein
MTEGLFDERPFLAPAVRTCWWSSSRVVRYTTVEICAFMFHASVLQ